MKNNRKEYGKIWVAALFLTLIACVLYCIVITYVVENWVQQNGGDLIAPAYLAHFADLTEKRFAGTMEEFQENSIVATNEDLWNMYYQTVNDKVQPGGFLMGESGFIFYKSGGVSVYDLATVLWIADKDGNIVLPGDYTVFHHEKEWVLADMAACFSEEDLQKITQIKCEAMNRPPFPGHTIEMTKYVMRDGICYPLQIVVTKEDGEVLIFEGTPDFEITTSELVTDASYEWWDEPQDITDPNYREIKEYTQKVLAGHTAGEKYDAVKMLSSWGKIGNKYLKTTQYILNDGEYLLCKGELSDYGYFLQTVIWLGWVIIAVAAVFIAAVVTLLRRRKLQKAEYERAITNALAHDYKSSLMIQRGYAENLIYGVSEEKKSLYEQKIMDEIDKMDLRTERLLSLFRTNAGGQPVREEEINVETLCRELIQNYEEVSRKRGLTWKFEEGASRETDQNTIDKDSTGKSAQLTGKVSSEPQSKSMIILGDKVLLSMALDNLIHNACKYSLADSEILLRFTKNSLTIENQWQPVEKFLKKPALFWEPYVTGDDARTSRNSGIGLAAARQILERMHLKLSVKVDREEIAFMVKKRSKGKKSKGSGSKVLSMFLMMLMMFPGCGTQRQVSIPADEVQVDRLYYYEYNGTKGIFLLTKAPAYTKGGGCEYKYGKKAVNLNYYAVADGSKVDNNPGESYLFQYDLAGQTKLFLNGKEVWNAENGTASRDVPAYVIEAAKQSAARKQGDTAHNYSFTYGSREGEIYMNDGNGVVMTWDLDGNVLSVRDDSYLKDPYWSK